MINKIRTIFNRKREKSELHSDSEEKGIALLMTLGMLAMILVIGLGFATSATMNAKATSIAADKTNAEFLVQSAIARIAYLANHGENEIISHGYTYNDTFFTENSTFKIYYSPQDWIYQLAYAKGREMHKPYDLIFGSTGSKIYNDVTWEYITGPYKNKHDGYYTAAGRNWPGDTDHPLQYGYDYDPTNSGTFNSKIDEQNTEEIYGRIAYWLVPSIGLDPAALVSEDVDEYNADEIRVGSRVSEINVGALDDEDNKYRFFKSEDPLLTWQGHTGGAVDVKEFNYQVNSGHLQNAWGNTSPPAGYKDFLPYPYGYGWATSSINPSIFTELLTGTYKINNLDEEHARKWFSEKPEPTQEKYWLDINLDNATDEDTEIFHRFNLARTDWDSLDVVDIIGSENDADGNVTHSIDSNGNAVDIYHPNDVYPKTLAKTDTTKDDGSVIPWIANWSDPGTFKDARTRAAQIAANLIDYCDENTSSMMTGSKITPIPTSDIDPALWDQTHTPTYTGNELTYYINEITTEAKFLEEQQTDPSDSTKKKNIYTGTINIYVESVYIYEHKLDAYGGSLPTDFDIYIDGRFSYDCVDSNGAIQHMIENLTARKLEYADTVTSGNFIVHKLHAPIDLSFAEGTYGGSNPLSITNVKFTVNKVWMKDSDSIGKTHSIPTNTGFDYVALWDSTGTAKPKEETIAGPLTADGSGYCYAQFDLSIGDPRQNLNYDDWSDMETSTDDWSSNPISTINENNKDADPSFASDTATKAIKDKESITKIVDAGAGEYLSTAYIRNAPMISPWELGCISRGAQWETINLHEYNGYENDTKNGGILGGGQYTDAVDEDASDDQALNGGDANILDQIKMESLIQTPMKVSFNCDDSLDIFYALVYNIQYDDNYDDFYYSGATLNYTVDTSRQIQGDTAAEIAKALSEADIKNRAQVANITELTDGSWISGLGPNELTDAEQEELIGKFINLTSTATIGGASSTEVKRAVILVQVIHDFGGSVDNDGNKIEETIYRDIDGDGDFDGNVVETGLDLDGINYTYKKGSSFNYKDVILGTSTVSTTTGRNTYLTGNYKDNYEQYRNNTNILSPVKMDPAATNNKEKIYATKGRYDQYADEIAYEMKVLVELKWDTVLSKYKVIKYEVIGD